MAVTVLGQDRPQAITDTVRPPISVLHVSGFLVVCAGGLGVEVVGMYGTEFAVTLREGHCPLRYDSG